MPRGRTLEELEAARSTLVLNAKFDELTAYVVVAAFCLNLSIEAASKRSRLSWKSTKALYVDLRERLLHAHFNRWHEMNSHTDLESFHSFVAEQVRYFFVVAHCAEQKTCHRNYHLGNRKSRVCRTCPLLKFIDPEDDPDDIVASIHKVQKFYQRLDWRAENEVNHGLAMMKRTYHKIIFDTAYLASKVTDRSFPRADDQGFLSVATLFRTMIGSLARYPLRSTFDTEPPGTPLPSEPIDLEVMKVLFFNVEPK